MMTTTAANSCAHERSGKVGTPDGSSAGRRAGASWKGLFGATVGVALVMSGGPALGQIETDGTLGPRISLGGPDYAIGAGLGQTRGGNLFHSFERFSIRTGESATFSGGAGLDNVIARVTGGESSSIDGLLRSTVSGAALWFLNAAGVAFGPNATLDVQGSFHVSTADELRFADGSAFSASAAAGGSLSLAAPEAFGFLGARSGELSVAGSHLMAVEGGLLELAAGEVTNNRGALLVADGADPGTIRIEAGRLVVDDATVRARNLGGRPAGGVVRIVGRTVALRAGGLLAADTAPASGGGAGRVVVDAERLSLTGGSQIDASTFGAGPAGAVGVDAGEVVIRSNGRGAFTGIGSDSIVGARADFTGIGATAEVGSSGDAGRVVVRADRIEIGNGGQIRSSTFGPGRAGRVVVEAETLTVRDGRPFDADLGEVDIPPVAAGDAGEVVVRGGVIEVQAGGQIRALSFGSGAAGDIVVDAEKLLIEGDDAGFVTGLFSSGEDASSGATGTITVRLSDRLKVWRGSEIRSSTFGGGDAGRVEIEAGSVLVSGAESIFFTGIASSIETGASGAGGIVSVAADGDVVVRDDGRIQSVTFGSGDAGAVTVSAARIRLRSGGQISSSTFEQSTGRSGDVVLRARDSISIAGQSAFLKSDPFGDFFPPSGAFASTESAAAGAGPGGSVSAEAPVIEVMNRGEIASESFNDARGGDVRVRAGRRLEVRDGEITTKASFADAGDLGVSSDGLIVLREGGEISTTVFEAGSTGNAGAITVAGQLLVLDAARIQANGVIGQGGEVDVVADQLIQSPESVIEALSELGIDGTVSLAAPETGIVGNMAVLPTAFLDAAGLLRPGCSERTAGRGRGSFTSFGRGGMPPGPAAPLRSLYAPSEGSARPARAGGSPAALTRAGGCLARR